MNNQQSSVENDKLQALIAEAESDFPIEVLSGIKIPYSLPQAKLSDKFTLTNLTSSGGLVPFVGCLCYLVVGLILGGAINAVSFILYVFVASFAAYLLGPIYQTLRSRGPRAWILSAAVVGGISGLAVQIFMLLLAGAYMAHIGDVPNQSFDLILANILLYPKRVAVALIAAAIGSVFMGLWAKRELEQRPWFSGKPSSRFDNLVRIVVGVMVLCISAFSLATLPSLEDRKQPGSFFMADMLLSESIESENWSTLETILAIQPNALEWKSIGSPYLAKAKSPRMVTYLLDRGADINDEGGWGMTPLSWACKTKNGDLALALLHKGADPNLGTPKPLDVASKVKDRGMVALLLKFGADLKQSTSPDEVMSVFEEASPEQGSRPE